MRCGRLVILIVLPCVSAMSGHDAGAAARPRSAISDFKVESSSDSCNASAQANLSGTLIYGENTNTKQAVQATIKYADGGDSFEIYNSNLQKMQEHYPKTFVSTFAPGERRPIGCSRIVRSLDLIESHQPITVTVVGASYAPPGSPSFPTQDPLQYVALYIRTTASCPDSGGRPAGQFVAVNLDPMRPINVKFPTINNRGQQTGLLNVNLDVAGTSSIVCSVADAVNDTVGAATAATFVGVVQAAHR